MYASARTVTGFPLATPRRISAPGGSDPKSAIVDLRTLSNSVSRSSTLREFELRLADVIVLLEAVQLLAIAARKAQRAIAHHPLGVAEMSQHLLDTPLARRRRGGGCRLGDTEPATGDSRPAAWRESRARFRRERGQCSSCRTRRIRSCQVGRSWKYLTRSEPGTQLEAQPRRPVLSAVSRGRAAHSGLRRCSSLRQSCLSCSEVKRRGVPGRRNRCSRRRG